jgi:hypothetical protein
MNPSMPPSHDAAFPVVFVVISTFVGALAWLCVILNQLTAH